MKITLITPGTGTFYCGVCLRDEVLSKALRAQGHEVDWLPVYLPLVREHAKGEDGEDSGREVFFGGINVYLQQHLPFFRKSSRRFDKVFDSSPALALAARMGEMTKPSKLGAMTLSMLEGERGRQGKELERMIAWLRERPPPDVICLATSLQAGMLRELKRAFPLARLVCFFQGEDEFLDALAGDYPRRCWREMAAACVTADRLITPSRYFRRRMAERLAIAEDAFTVLPNALELDDFLRIDRGAAPVAPARIGYLARMCPEKGLDLLVDAYIRLCRQRGGQPPELLAMGVVKGSDRAFVKEQQDKLAAAGLAEHARFRPNVTLEEKLAGLAELSLFSVPARYSEAFGLYVVEAMAAGLPCVLPRHAAFPEIVEDGVSGRIYSPHNAEGLADALAEALADPEKFRAYAANARVRARECFSIDTYATQLVELVTPTTQAR